MFKEFFIFPNLRFWRR